MLKVARTGMWDMREKIVRDTKAEAMLYIEKLAYDISFVSLYKQQVYDS